MPLFISLSLPVLLSLRSTLDVCPRSQRTAAGSDALRQLPLRRAKQTAGKRSLLVGLCIWVFFFIYSTRLTDTFFFPRHEFSWTTYSVSKRFPGHSSLVRYYEWRLEITAGRMAGTWPVAWFRSRSCLICNHVWVCAAFYSILFQKHVLRQCFCADFQAQPTTPLSEVEHLLQHYNYSSFYSAFFLHQMQQHDPFLNVISASSAHGNEFSASLSSPVTTGVGLADECLPAALASLVDRSLFCRFLGSKLSSRPLLMNAADMGPEEAYRFLTIGSPLPIVCLGLSNSPLDAAKQSTRSSGLDYSSTLQTWKSNHDHSTPLFLLVQTSATSSQAFDNSISTSAHWIACCAKKMIEGGILLFCADADSPAEIPDSTFAELSAELLGHS